MYLRVHDYIYISITHDPWCTLQRTLTVVRYMTRRIWKMRYITLRPFQFHKILTVSKRKEIVENSRTVTYFSRCVCWCSMFLLHREKNVHNVRGLLYIFFSFLFNQYKYTVIKPNLTVEARHYYYDSLNPPRCIQIILDISLYLSLYDYIHYYDARVCH